MDTVLAISLVLVQNSFTVVYLVRGLTYIIVVDQCLGTRSSITGRERITGIVFGSRGAYL